ncbi:hypothetical protein GW916_03120 [bacterium]|nr:hypothetical protein [bacterium]
MKKLTVAFSALSLILSSGVAFAEIVVPIQPNCALYAGPKGKLFHDRSEVGKLVSEGRTTDPVTGTVKEKVSYSSPTQEASVEFIQFSDQMEIWYVIKADTNGDGLISDQDISIKGTSLLPSSYALYLSGGLVFDGEENIISCAMIK